MRLPSIRLGLLLALCAVAGWTMGRTESAGAEKGPRISAYGAVFDVPKPDFPTPLDQNYKAVFDVARAPNEPDRLNPSIETLARFLNMHARAGVPEERVRVALVLHGAARKYALQNTSYQARFHVDNPNLELLEELRAAGVRVILCGQTAASRSFERDELSASVELALSAMTFLITLQSDGISSSRSNASVQGNRGASSDHELVGVTLLVPVEKHFRAPHPVERASKTYAVPTASSRV